MNDVPLWLRGDPTRLRQALLNYAANAVKFTHRGQITLRAVLLNESDNGLLIRFEVEDSGIGVDPEKLPGLFRAFEQADTSITRKYGGTGLGAGHHPAPGATDGRPRSARESKRHRRQHVLAHRTAQTRRGHHAQT